MQRIGVFVCHCGSNIAATVDVKKVAEMALHEPGVVHAEDYQYMCSEAGQEKIKEAIQQKHLTGLVVLFMFSAYARDGHSEMQRRERA